MKRELNINQQVMKKIAAPKKALTKLFRVNLQEGFIVDAEANTIYGAYSVHNKAVITVTPWSKHDFEMPKELKGYTVGNRYVSHFSLTGWTSRGHRSIHALVKPLSKREKIFEKL